MKFLRVFCFSVIFLLVFIIGFWHIAITSDFIESVITKTARKSNFDIRFVSIQKGLFYNVKINSVEINHKSQDKSRQIITLNSVNLYPSLLSIIRLRPVINLNAICGSGNIKGHFTIGDVFEDVLISVKGPNIFDLDLLKDYGINGSGRLELNMAINKGQGEWTLEVQDCNLNKWTMNDIPIPLDMFQIIRGVGYLKKGVIEIKSFTLDGAGIQAMIKGVISSKANLTMEILAGKGFQYLPVLDVSLLRFKRSDGFFVIPLNLDNLTSSNVRRQ